MTDEQRAFVYVQWTHPADGSDRGSPAIRAAAVVAYLAALTAERRRIAAGIKSLLDGDFCGSDVEALEAALGVARHPED